jgi:hypothetical protein
MIMKPAMKMQFEVLIKPGSKHGPLIEANTDSSMKVYLSEQFLEGKTNARLIELIAKHYDVPKSRVKIIKGLSTKNKIIRIN